MSLSTLPLSYCTNVHPGLTVDAVVHGLKTYTIPAQQAFGQRLAAGLWLAAPVIQELLTDRNRLVELQTVLRESGLVCYTLNAFPFGNFHSDRVKENVYLPDWSQPERRTYTLGCAQVLSELLPVGTEGSISTVPLGFKGVIHPPGFEQACIDQLLELAVDLDQIHDETGQVIRLAIEPEPCCVLETTAETLAFFQKLFQVAEQRQLEEVARRHLGVCYDICHQAVEFEDIPASIQSLSAADIRINKVHVTCAIHVDRPGENPEALKQLSQFVEPRYLHQTFARVNSGGVVHQLDLTQELCSNLPPEFQQAQAWRVHFHVPVHQESAGLLRTTRDELPSALKAIAGLLYAPHLEVETYTWGVLPGTEVPSLVHGITQELTATAELLDELRKSERD